MRVGTKRVIFFTAVGSAVLCITLLLLFQSGIDEKVVNSIVPKVEKRLGVNISYQEINASLTSLSLMNLVIKEKESGCTLAAVDRIGIGFRVGPLFFGKVDLTGIRIEGLEVKIGEAVSDCNINTWKMLNTTIAKETADNNEYGDLKNSASGKPVIIVTSGKVIYEDSSISAILDGISGKTYDLSDSVYEIATASSSMSNIMSVTSGPINVKYAKKENKLNIDINGVYVEIINIIKNAKNIIKTINDLHAKYGYSQLSDNAVPFDLSRQNVEIPNKKADMHVSMHESQCAFLDFANNKDKWVVRDIVADATMDKQDSVAIRASGVLPGADAKFVFNEKRNQNGLYELNLKIPDISLYPIGEMLFPSSHVGWNDASMGADIKVILDSKMDIVDLEGHSVFTNFSLMHERIALEPLKNLSFGADFKIRYLREDNEIVFERLLLSKELFRLTLTGIWKTDRTAFDLHLKVPISSCNNVAEALPEQLKYKLKNTKLDGKISAEVHVAVDENEPEKTLLDVNINNQCRIKEFGDMPEAGYFRGPFSYIAYTENNEPLRLITGPGTDRWTPYRNISPFLIEAVLTTEDGKFWTHKGITVPEIRRAIELNLRSKNFKHGASTITMQLAKNLFLSRERTIARKMQETVFVWYLETYFSKEELLELYFNIIEFGPSIYGISDAAMYYFGRETWDLTALESAFLIKLLPNPKVRHKPYERGNVSVKHMAQLHRLLKTMRDRKRLTELEYQDAIEDSIIFHKKGNPLPPPRDIPYHELKGKGFAEDIFIDPMEEDE